MKKFTQFDSTICCLVPISVSQRKWCDEAQYSPYFAHCW